MKSESEKYTELVRRLDEDHDLSDSELTELIESPCPDDELFDAADRLRRSIYGEDVYIRGLIEFTNHCKNNCYYCGIRRDNGHLDRYRLTDEQIMQCCAAGYELGYRTYVLQGGEDPYYDDDHMCRLISAIKEKYPDCAVTLSIGEKSRESYQRYFDAGADRYLLRHETADDKHYRKLHPASMSLAHRKKCLYELKDIGYAVGAGFMVGSPYQTTENYIADLRFMQGLDPDMIGIGPYIPQSDTPFRDQPAGTLRMTLRMLGILRLMFPDALIPATTALGTIDPQGREKGFRAGANVVMPNLSPTSVREKYLLYDEKICTGEDAYQCRGCLEGRVYGSGYRMVCDRGDRKRYIPPIKREENRESMENLK